jgi:hypothetical protein
MALYIGATPLLVAIVRKNYKRNALRQVSDMIGKNRRKYEVHARALCRHYGVAHVRC